MSSVSGSKMEAFKYHPILLDRPGFRLFRLHQGSFGTDISGELFVAYLDQPENIVPFEALSYTWGDPILTDTIAVDKKALRVTNNLSLALQYLRSKDSDRILWIDAICIDQKDDRERGHQVQHMGNIYAVAERVICWLGLATYETNVVMESLQSLQKASIKSACRDWKSSDQRWAGLWLSIQPTLAEKHTHLLARQQEGLESLLQRAWFERVWIIQEVANAKAAYTQCGERSVSTRIFGLAPTLLDAALEPRCKAVLDIMPGPLRKYSWWSESRDLYSLLRHLCKSKALDPRDMIFALLGISTDASSPGFPKADYTKSVGETIQEVTKYLYHVDLSSIISENMEHFWRQLPSLNTYALRQLVRAPTRTQSIRHILRRGNDVQIKPDVIRAVSSNKIHVKVNLGLLFKHVFEHEGGQELMTALLKSIASNVICYPDATDLLLQQEGMETSIISEVLAAAAANEGESHYNMNTLLEQKGVDTLVTEQVLIDAAAEEIHGTYIIDLLVEKNGVYGLITPEVLIAAAEEGRFGLEIMKLLLHQDGAKFAITPDVYIAAGIKGIDGVETITLLLRREFAKKSTTSEVLLAAAKNTGGRSRGYTILRLLFQ